MIRPVRFLSALLLSLCALNACRADVFTFSFAGDPAYNNYFNPYGDTPPVGYDPVAVTSFNFTMTTPNGAPPDYVDTYSSRYTSFSFVSSYISVQQPDGTTSLGSGDITYNGQYLSPVWQIDLVTPNSANDDTDFVIYFHNPSSDELADALSFSGVQLFSGPVSSPSLTPGIYSLLENDFDQQSNGGNSGTLTIAAEAPEISPLLLVATGLLATILTARIRVYVQ